jgi:hypothetical protein
LNEEASNIMADFNLLVDAAYHDKTPQELADAPVYALKGVSRTDAEALKRAFGVRTIRDLAQNRFVLQAQAIDFAAEMPPPAPNNAALLEQLRQATEGLLYISETDAPYEPFVWTREEFGADSVTSETLRAYKGLPFETPVDTMPVSSWLARAAPPEHPHSPRYLFLLRVLTAQLTELAVWRIGTVQIDIFVVGKTANGDFAGVATKAVET